MKLKKLTGQRIKEDLTAIALYQISMETYLKVRHGYEVALREHLEKNYLFDESGAEWFVSDLIYGDEMSVDNFRKALKKLKKKKRTARS